MLQRKNFKQKMQALIFRNESVNNVVEARILNKDDFKRNKGFFSKIHLEINSDEWLQEYFQEKVIKGYFNCYFT